MFYYLNFFVFHLGKIGIRVPALITVFWELNALMGAKFSTVHGSLEHAMNFSSLLNTAREPS